MNKQSGDVDMKRFNSNGLELYDDEPDSEWVFLDKDECNCDQALALKREVADLKRTINGLKEYNEELLYDLRDAQNK